MVTYTVFCTLLYTVIDLGDCSVLVQKDLPSPPRLFWWLHGIPLFQLLERLGSRMRGLCQILFLLHVLFHLALDFFFLNLEFSQACWYSDVYYSEVLPLETLSVLLLCLHPVHFSILFFWRKDLRVCGFQFVLFSLASFFFLAHFIALYFHSVGRIPQFDLLNGGFIFHFIPFQCFWFLIKFKFSLTSVCFSNHIFGPALRMWCPRWSSWLRAGADHLNESPLSF